MLFGRQQLFRGNYCLHLDGRKVRHRSAIVHEVTDQITTSSIRWTDVDPNKHKGIGQVSK